MSVRGDSPTPRAGGREWLGLGVLLLPSTLLFMTPDLAAALVAAVIAAVAAAPAATQLRHVPPTGAPASAGEPAAQRRDG